MRLSAHSDYALRLLMQLASNIDQRCTINDVSQTYHVSKNHMMKIANLMVNEGFIVSIRGRNGGLKLAKLPCQLNIGEIIRATEGELAILDCLQKDSNKLCVVDSACRFKDALAKATTAFIEVLDNYTLADIVDGNHELYSILTLEIQPSSSLSN